MSYPGCVFKMSSLNSDSECRIPVACLRRRLLIAVQSVVFWLRLLTSSLDCDSECRILIACLRRRLLIAIQSVVFW